MFRILSVLVKQWPATRDLQIRPAAAAAAAAAATTTTTTTLQRRYFLARVSLAGPP